MDDGVILVTLKEGHLPTAGYVHKLREALPAAFPEATFYFQAADMVTQILNFGIPAQIDVRTVGYDRATNLAVARELMRRGIAAIPGIADAHVQQEVDAPEFYAVIDRARAAQFGLTANSIATNLNVSLSVVGPGLAEFLDRSVDGNAVFPRGADAGAPHLVARRPAEHPGRIVHLPERQSGAADAGKRRDAQARRHRPTPTTPTSSRSTRSMPMSRTPTSAGLARDINKVVAEASKKLKPGNRIEVLGQIESMNSAFQDMGLGLLFASVFVYLLMVVNYRTRRSLRRDPRLAGDLLGIVTMLYITGTDAQRAVADGRDHGDRRRLRELHPARHLRA